jgi:hypothetical protein
MPEGVQAIVLCEDLQAWVFVRRMLMELGYDSHRIRVIPYPADGRGSGEQHVRERYPGELRTHRSRVTRTRAALIVHVDADVLSIQERHATLDHELERADVVLRTPDEAVAVLVPKRNIETWIHFFLEGPPVDEEGDYAKYDRESEAWPASRDFAKHVRQGSQPAGAPPSLLGGIEEGRRLL